MLKYSLSHRSFYFHKFKSEIALSDYRKKGELVLIFRLIRLIVRD